MESNIHQEVKFKVEPAEVYQALMESRKHTAFTKNGLAKISRRVSGAFLPMAAL